MFFGGHRVRIVWFKCILDVRTEERTWKIRSEEMPGSNTGGFYIKL